MSIPAFGSLVLLLLTVPLDAAASPADPVTASHPQPSTSTAAPPTPPTYDQIVRLSLVEGDVRIARGKEGEHAAGGAWGQATADIPIESGFSLATGKGRAEIELEDASTVYLGEDSVLTFNELTATGGVPHTDMTLVSGTATVSARPEFAGELFVMRTPVGNISVRYPDVNFIRVNSYLDAMALTPQEDADIHQGSMVKSTGKGQTTTYNRYGQIVPAAPEAQNEFAEWDEWTAKRIAARNLAMTASMKDAGLTSPIPGLAEMKGQGTFFACEPYGTCWQPTNGWGEQDAAPQRLEAQQTSNPSLGQSAQSDPHTISVKALQAAGPSAITRTSYEEPFPCSPDQISRVIAKDPLTGRNTVLRTGRSSYAAPYDWAVCHSGTWIHHEHRYVWVAGMKRHHECPVHWVKYGGAKGYVPIHPHDVAGRAPINLRHGVFETTGRKGESVQHVAFNAQTPVKLLSTAPKEFLKPSFPPLQHAETPRLEAHLVKDGLAPGKEGASRPTGTAINFDHRSQSIMLARQVMQDGKNTTVTQHFGGRGDGFQAHNGGGNYSGSLGHSSSTSGSGSHSSFSGGGSGGFHGSSGGGGGGGSHASSGGGGGVSSGGGGMSSGGGGSSSGSGGGSHK